MINKLYYGAAYYPELWPEKDIDKDIRYMKRVGITVVRMGEFAWAKMEPKPDKIDLDFFVRVIDKLYRNGISTIFCTPTPTPPIWISHGHPERMFVNQTGTVMSHGARQHCCTNNPFFRERCRIIITAICENIAHLPGIIAWQTDNEFKAHVAECMCKSCKELWHKWLKERYGTIDALNDAWGTHIWSEYYQDFSQVPQPLPTPALHNASLATAYRVFSHEKIAEFQDEQLEIIRRYSDAPITHNSNRRHFLNHDLIYRNLDFASFDAYDDCDSYEAMLMNYDFWRTIKKRRPFWVMETSNYSNGCLLGYCKIHRKKYLIAEAVAAYSLGAQGFCYWLWKQQRSGVEMPHGAVLSTWGAPTVGFKETAQVNRVRKKIEPIILGSKPSQAEIAITYSDRARAFFLTEPLEALDYCKLMQDWYKRVLDTGIHRDVILESADLEGYKILMTPFLPYISKDYFEKAKRFVEDGGIWIVGPLSGGRTQEHTLHTEAALGGQLESIAGVETVFTYSATNSGAEGSAFGITAPLGLWSTFFKSRGAKVMGIVKGGRSPECAFLTEHKVGRGKVVMLGSMPQGEKGTAMLQAMIQHYAAEKDISLRAHISKGTIIAPRKTDAGMLWVVINMDGKGGEVEIPSNAVDLLSGEKVKKRRLEIGVYDYRIIKLASSSS